MGWAYQKGASQSISQSIDQMMMHDGCCEAGANEHNQQQQQQRMGRRNGFLHRGRVVGGGFWREKRPNRSRLGCVKRHHSIIHVLWRSIEWPSATQNSTDHQEIKSSQPALAGGLVQPTHETETLDKRVRVRQQAQPASHAPTSTLGSIDGPTTCLNQHVDRLIDVVAAASDGPID